MRGSFTTWRQAEATLPRKRATRRHDGDEAIDRERAKDKGARVHRIGKDADLGQPARDGVHDVLAPPFLEVDVDLRMGGQPPAEPVRQEFIDGDRVRQQRDRRAYALRVVAELTRSWATCPRISRA